MTTSRLGVREITRNFNILENYDYVEIEDKKTHVLKGLFVSAELLNDVKAFIDAKLQTKQRDEIDDMMQLMGKGSIDKRFESMSARELREAIAEEKHAD
jgi:hypothetical protein